jgi:hypothetical protein
LGRALASGPDDPARPQHRGQRGGQEQQERRTGEPHGHAPVDGDDLHVGVDVGVDLAQLGLGRRLEELPAGTVGDGLEGGRVDGDVDRLPGALDLGVVGADGDRSTIRAAGVLAESAEPEAGAVPAGRAARAVKMASPSAVPGLVTRRSSPSFTASWSVLGATRTLGLASTVTTPTE